MSRLRKVILFLLGLWHRLLALFAPGKPKTAICVSCGRERTGITPGPIGQPLCQPCSLSLAATLLHGNRKQRRWAASAALNKRPGSGKHSNGRKR